MRNLKIGKRLGIGFTLMMLLVIAVALFGVNRLAVLDDEADKMAENYYPKTVQANNLISAVNVIARAVRNIIILNDNAEDAKERLRITEARKVISDNLALLEKNTTSVKGKEVLAHVLEARAKYASDLEMYIKLEAEGKEAEAKALLFGQMRTTQNAYIKTLETLIAYENSQMKEAEQKINSTFQTSRILIYMAAGIALFMGILISILITRSITRPINEAVKVAQTVASGDLTSNITVQSKDEPGQLMQALKDMNDSLAKIVGEVRTGTDTIATASAQIASGNQDLSSRTEEQASSLEETASSMEELTSTVRQNADNSRQANQLAFTASDIAVKGGAVVSQVVDTMEAINTSSKKIVDIISVIDGIAFQTNILALNAAVEAARAGEQGRGFAVVASEVRNLAQRSASAAREIKTLIDDSVEKVDAGSKLVGEAGKTMEEIVASIKQVNDIMGEITAASQEQSDGIEQVNQAVVQMDTVTQQNAALVEEAAAAAESLQNQAKNLVEVVSVFKTGEHQLIAASSQAKLNVVSIASQKMIASPGQKPALRLAQATPKLQLTNAKNTAGENWEEF